MMHWLLHYHSYFCSLLWIYAEMKIMCKYLWVFELLKLFITKNTSLMKKYLHKNITNIILYLWISYLNNISKILVMLETDGLNKLIFVWTETNRICVCIFEMSKRLIYGRTISMKLQQLQISFLLCYVIQTEGAEKNWQKLSE